jgi:hypothetical protein
MARHRLIIAASVLLLLGSPAAAQNYLLTWNCISSGGAPGTGTGMQMNSTAGQVLQGSGIGSSNGGVTPDMLGYWGFWVPFPLDTSFGWRERLKMPLVPSLKYLKDGGWLAYNAGNNRIYAAKGNKVADFYAYHPTGDSWHGLKAWPDGAEAKRPSKGSAACTDGAGVVYATKGNNTPGFWSYHAGGDSWRQRANVPLGSTNKKVKGGTDIVYVNKLGGCAYLLKGYKNEFWRYHVTGDSWHQLRDAPVGANLKYDKGSWLAYDPDNKVLYAHKSKYHELHAYDVTADSWRSSPPLHAMPIVGSMGSRKAKDGSSGAWLGGCIYAFKGANSLEFWKYYIQGDSWREQETIPSYGSSAKKKRVKGGGDLVALSNTLYATKGNNCNELWRYLPRMTFAEPRPGRDGVSAEHMTRVERRMTIAPNPLVGGVATLRYSLRQAGAVSLTVYDVAGRSVFKQSLPAGRTGGTSLDLRHLSAGVYLMKFSSEDFAATQKLVVQR